MTPSHARHTLTTDHLSIGYATKKETSLVASQLSATLRSGELTCLVGANGAGKSTLLRTLSAFQPPLGGTVIVDGKPLSSLSSRRLATTIAVVLTGKIPAEQLTVRQLVQLGRSPYTGFWGICTAADEAIVEQSMTLVGITHLSERVAATLSDGERQKTMIAKALAQQTPIILLDEPTAFLDYPAKVETMLLLRRIAAETGKIIFLSTHDVELSLQLADKIWLLRRPSASSPSVLLTGSPEDLALEGHLTDFFNSRHLCFDAHTAQYAIRLTPVAALHVEGPSCQRHTLLLKALSRHGVQTLAPSVATPLPLLPFTVQVSPSQYRVIPTGEGVPRQSTSVHEVIEQVGWVIYNLRNSASGGVGNL